MASMTYFDSSRKNLTCFCVVEVGNGNAFHNKIHQPSCLQLFDFYV